MKQISRKDAQRLWDEYFSRFSGECGRCRAVVHNLREVVHANFVGDDVWYALHALVVVGKGVRERCPAGLHRRSPWLMSWWGVSSVTMTVSVMSGENDSQCHVFSPDCYQLGQAKKKLVFRTVRYTEKDDRAGMK